MIQHLREEIEQMDVNLIRFNVRTESNEFIKRIKEVGTGTDNSTTNLRKNSKNIEKANGLVKVKVNLFYKFFFLFFMIFKLLI